MKRLTNDQKLQIATLALKGVPAYKIVKKVPGVGRTTVARHLDLLGLRQRRSKAPVASLPASVSSTSLQVTHPELYKQLPVLATKMDQQSITRKFDVSIFKLRKAYDELNIVYGRGGWHVKKPAATVEAVPDKKILLSSEDFAKEICWMEKHKPKAYEEIPQLATAFSQRQIAEMFGVAHGKIRDAYKSLGITFDKKFRKWVVPTEQPVVEPVELESTEEPSQAPQEVEEVASIPAVAEVVEESSETSQMLSVPVVGEVSSDKISTPVVVQVTPPLENVLGEFYKSRNVYDDTLNHLVQDLSTNEDLIALVAKKLGGFFDEKVDEPIFGQTSFGPLHKRHRRLRKLGYSQVVMKVNGIEKGCGISFQLLDSLISEVETLRKKVESEGGEKTSTEASK